MLEWDNIRDETKRNEIYGIIATFLLFSLGILAEYLVNNGNTLIVIEDISTFSLTLLQILTTISTLVIAIIALLAGNVNDIYLGVSISNYYFNIKPYYFTQKRIIKLSIGYVLLSIILYVFELYNLIFSAFCSNLILIFISITAVYKIFFGKYVQAEEIKAYVESAINEKGNSAKIILTNYVDDWKRNVDFQNPNEYNEMSSFVQESLTSFLTDDETYLKYFEDTCYTILSFMLSSDKTIVKCFGIEFLNDIYQKIYVHIRDNAIKLSHLNIYSNIEEEFVRAMYDVKYDKFNRIIDIPFFVEIIISTQLLLYKNCIDKKMNKIPDITCAIRLPSYFVHNMTKQGVNQNDISNTKLEKLLNNSFIYENSNISEDLIDSYQFLINMSLMNLYVSLFNEGYDDLLIESLYLNGINSKYEIMMRAEAVLILSIHCYLYYCAYKETEECISEDLRYRAYNVLNGENVKKAYSQFISYLSDNESWFNFEMKEFIRELTSPHELFPKYENSKVMLMSHVVNEFYVFTVAYIAYTYPYKKDIYKNLNDSDLMSFVILNRLDKTKENFKSFYLLIENSDENIEENIDLIVKELLEITQDKHKNRLIIEARKISNDVITNTKNINSIKKKVEKRILSSYGSIVITKKINDVSSRINIIKTYIPKNLLNEAINKNLLTNNINSIIFGWLIKQLQSEQLSSIKLIESVNYVDYLKLLDNPKIEFLGGSLNIYKSVGYNKKEEIDTYYKKIKNTLNVHSSKDIIIIYHDGLRINLHDIIVNIRPSLITDVNKFYAYPNKIYKHSVINGLEVQFNELEFEEFVSNYYCTITVDIDLSISTYDQKNEAGLIIKTISKD